MTIKQTKNLFDFISATWGSGRDITSKEQGIWYSVLINMDFGVAEKAINDLYKQRGQKEYDSLAKLMPEFKGFYYTNQPTTSNKNRSWCPCCNATGFIVLESAINAETAYPCHCKTGRDRSFNACENLNCQNLSHFSKVVVLAGHVTRFPWEAAAFGKCKYRPVVTEVKNFGFPFNDPLIQYLSGKVDISRYLVNR